MRGHAIANRLFVCAANRMGVEGNLNFWGNSFLCEPDGYVTQKLSTDAGALFAQIDFDAIDTQRSIWPHLRDRRVDLYGDVLKMWAQG
jgi:N-carbamoylputrescine amidase